MKPHTTIYLSGPMSGLPQFNIPLFDQEAARLRKKGFKVVSPAELDDPIFRDLCVQCESGTMAELRDRIDIHNDRCNGTVESSTWGELLARDVKLLSDDGVEAVLLLPGWEKSRGARLESFVATLNELPLYEWDQKGHFHEVTPVAWYVRTQPLAPFSVPDHLPNAETALPPRFRQAGMAEVVDTHGELADAHERMQVDTQTGGRKAVKAERYDLLPWDVLDEDARLYESAVAIGKYDAHNWRKGFAWSSSFSSAMRHLRAFWQYGESIDPETGCHHLASARFHCAALMHFEKAHPEKDDRHIVEVDSV